MEGVEYALSRPPKKPSGLEMKEFWLLFGYYWKQDKFWMEVSPEGLIKAMT